MGLGPTQGNEKHLGPAFTLCGTGTSSLSSREVVTFFDFAQKGLLIDVHRPTTALALGNGPLLSAALSYLSSRAKPRDLQFRGHLLETRTTILKQNCHLDRRSHGLAAHPR